MLEKFKFERKKLNKFELCSLYFFIYALIGWIAETLYAIFELGHFVKRGFLLGCICPIYGFGALMMILFLGKYKKNNLKLFFLSAIIFSIFEYIVSYFLEAFFQIKCWDYTNKFFNLNGRITLSFSIIWGFAALLFIYRIHPFIKHIIKKMLNKISFKIQLSLVYVSSFFILIDTVLSSVKYLV